MQAIKDKIRNIPDFPQKGILFRDITTAVKDPKTFIDIVDYFYDIYKNEKIDYVAAIESRGYIFGAPLAYKLGAGLVIVRKPGKLPAKVERIEYALEYGADALEIHYDAVEAGKKVLVIDDLLATGGTVCAACKLITKVGGDIIGVAFLIELESLKGREKLPSALKITSMLTY